MCKYVMCTYTYTYNVYVIETTPCRKIQYLIFYVIIYTQLNNICSGPC